MNAFDAVPRPYGFGVAAEGEGRVPDLAEPIHLVRELSIEFAPLTRQCQRAASYV